MPLVLTALLLLLEQTVPGVTWRVYQLDAQPDRIPTLVPDQTPNIDTVHPTIRFSDRDFGDVTPPLVAEVRTTLRIDRPGRYGFQLISDDGARATLDGHRIVDNDGLHGPQPAVGWIMLEQGPADLWIEYFDGGGTGLLELTWQPPGRDAFEPIPTAALATEDDPTRVTAPGPKRTIDQAGRPGDGRPLEGVHPGWRVENIRPEGFEPKVGALAFLPDGRLAIGTFDPLQRDDRNLPDIESKEPDKLYALSGLLDDDKPVRVEPIATDLYEPSGLCVVDGVLYVAHRKAVTRLLDQDGDGFFETHEDVGGGWEAWNYHQFAFGLVHRDGKLYTGLSTAMAPPGWEGMGTNAAPNGPLRGSIIEIDLSSNDTRVFAGGVRTPNCVGLGPDDSIWYADNQGVWMPCSQLSEVIPGRFYGHYNNTNVVPKLAERFPDGGHPAAWCDLPRTPASLLMPQGECANSPARPLMISDGPFAGQMLVAELTGGGIRRVSFDRVNGQWQCGVYRFTQGLESGINRMAWGPDGCLYVGGIGAQGNWNWRGTQYGLQRLRPTGAQAFEIAEVRAMPGGFRLTLTGTPSRRLTADDIEVRQWRYRPTAEYGGPKVEQEVLVSDIQLPGRSCGVIVPGRETWCEYWLRVPDLRPGSCVYVRLNPETSTADGTKMWSNEAWYTHNLPHVDLRKAIGDVTEAELEEIDRDPDAWAAGVERWARHGIGVGVLPPPEAVTLIGRSANMAMHRDQGTPRTGGRTQAEILASDDYVEIAGGDLASNTVFGDARLHIEWYCPPGGEGQMAGNSGVYLHDRYEIQILGTPAGDQPPADNEAGALYRVKAADVNASTGPGTWQAYDILFTAPRFDGETKIADARATVLWNGRRIHNDIVLQPTGSRSGQPEHAVGPLILQDHATDAEGPVRFRNVWIAPLEPREDRPGAWRRLVPPKVDLSERWTPIGGEASYRVEGDTVIGTTRPHTPNTFLVTREQYGDFELLLEAKQHVDLNSGIQIRSHVDGGLENRNGPLRGYQVELDPTERAFSAGIYDEARRGWLFPLIDAPYARRAYRRDDWNRIRIVARGPVIRTWINGVPAAAIFDAMTPKGHIGLQVHDVGGREDPLEVRFRNIRLRELRTR